jgi:putative transposase
MDHLISNGCIHHIKNKQCGKEIDPDRKLYCSNKKHGKFKYKHSLSKIDLRKQVIDGLSTNDWVSDLPYDSKTLTVFQAHQSWATALTNRINGNINHFNLGYKSRKNKNQSFSVDYRTIKYNEILDIIQLFPRGSWKGNSELKIKNKKDRKWLIRQFKKGPEIYKKYDKKIVVKKDFIPCDFTIKFEYPNRYYLCVPSFRTKKYTKPEHELVALDPGVRTFQTFYSPSGITGKLGDGTVNKLAIIGQRIDRMMSHASSEKDKRKKKRIYRRCAILRTKISNIVNNLHWKSADYLTKTFKTILIPKFEVSSMISINGRNIQSRTVRKMLSLSHYKFRQRLLNMGKERNRNVIECGEAFTSKTCGCCGKINEKLKGSKIFVCPSKTCNVSSKIVIDRDVNGARNVLLRILTQV